MHKILHPFQNGWLLNPFFHPLYAQNFGKTDDYSMTREHREKDILIHYGYACKWIQSSLEGNAAVSIKKVKLFDPQLYL